MARQTKWGTSTTLNKNKITVFITNDKNLRYQQNTNKLDLIIIELNSIGNHFDVTAPIITDINKYLLSNKFRQFQKSKKSSYLIWK